ncbi:MAG TPA: calcium/sodium antiporter [Gemmatimonadota bacterium]|nr:calcium/sodium antiporter [Gemmatimonadota bacterium]
MPYVELLGGLIYLLMGGDLLVRGAVALARRARVSPVVIALSIVAFGTSLPELVVTLHAVVDGYPGIAMGNVVGSNIANVCLIIGLPASIYVLTCTERSTRRNSVLMLSVSALFFVLCLDGDLDRWDSAALLLALAAFVALGAQEALRTQREADRSIPLDWVLGLPSRVWMIALFLVAGAVGLPLGAGMLVNSVVEISSRLQIPDVVVGLTVVALGTSLPELATTFVAAWRREHGVAVGTAVGSNVFNVTGIMGAAALISPDHVPVPPVFLSLDLPVLLGSALLLVLLVVGRRRIGRLAGALMLLAYCVYLGALVVQA